MGKVTTKEIPETQSQCSAEMAAEELYPYGECPHGEHHLVHRASIDDKRTVFHAGAAWQRAQVPQDAMATSSTTEAAAEEYVYTEHNPNREGRRILIASFLAGSAHGYARAQAEAKAVYGQRNMVQCNNAVLRAERDALTAQLAEKDKLIVELGVELETERMRLAACGTLGWGFGTYNHKDETGKEDVGYGFPRRGMNPNDFHPDRECCTAEEIEKWERDKREFKP